MNNIGIYQIRNLINNKVYIGRASNLKRRKYEHFRTLKLNKHKNKHLQNAFNYYNGIYFIFEVLEFCEKDELIKQEHFWCNLKNSNNFQYGYNIALTGDIKAFTAHSEETKQKISKAHKGKKLSDATKTKLAIAHLGKHHTEYTKNKIKEWFLNNEHPMKKGHSEYSKKKISTSSKGKPSNNQKAIIAVIENTEIYFTNILQAAKNLECLNTSINNNLHGRSKTVKTNKGKIIFKYA